MFTVSYDQRQLIHDKLGIPLDKIGVTYNGWEHMAKVQPDDSIFEKMPGLKKGGYYYALGSLAAHKNFKWIREVARRNPDKTFVVAGGKDLRAFGDDTERHPQCVLPRLCFGRRKRRPDEALPPVFAPGGV